MEYRITYTSDIYTLNSIIVTQDTTTSNSSGTFVGYPVTSISGTLNGAPITGLTSPGGFGGNDNIFLFSQHTPDLDAGGLSFTTASNQLNLNYNGHYTMFGANSPSDSSSSSRGFGVTVLVASFN